MLWLNGALLLLVVVLALALQLPAVQTFLAQKATVFLASRFHTTVKIGRFTTDWRNSIVLKEIYIADEQNDTLLYAGRLGLDLHILGARRSRLSLRSVKIENGVLKIKSDPADSTYNFTFLTKAFSSPNTDPNANATAFSLKISNLQLENIRFRLIDPVRGRFGDGTIGKFTMHAQNFDTKTQRYDLGTLKLENSMILGRKTQNQPQNSSPDSLAFTFKKLILANNNADLSDQPAAQRLRISIGTAELQADKIDLQNARADLSKFLLHNSVFRFYKLKTTTPETLANSPQKPTGKFKNQLWKVWLKEVSWQNNQFWYNDRNKPVRPQGVDFNHWVLQKFNLQLANVYYSQGRISGNVEAMQFQEKSGFKLQRMKGIFKAGADFLSFSNFELQTNQSLLREKIDLTWKPATGKSEGRVHFAVKLKNASLAPQDLLFITPDLAQKAVFRKLGKNKLRANGQISGGAGKMELRNFYLQGWSGTQVLLSGSIHELLDPDRRVSDLRISNLHTNRADLNTILGNGNGAPKLSFPARLSVNGSLRHQPGKLVFRQLNLKASNGTSLQTSGVVNTAKGKTHLDLEIKNLVTSRAALLAMLPPGTVSPEIVLPEHLQFAGGFRGSSIRHFALNGNFVTSFGNVNANVKVEPVQQFSGHISLQDFELGKLLKQEKMLGKATGKADFKGKGFKVQTMDLHYNAHIRKIEYKKDTYHNLKLEGNLNQKIYQLNGNLANAALQGLGHKLQKIIPKKLDLKKADPTRILPKKIEPKKLVPKFLRKKKKPEPEPKP